MYYFSERALALLGDRGGVSGEKRTSTLSAGVDASAGVSVLLPAAVRGSGTFSRVMEGSLTGEAKVDSTLRAISARGWNGSRRRVHKTLNAVEPHSVFDITVSNLRVGIMPFAFFGSLDKSIYGEGVRVFWGQAQVLPSPGGEISGTELILIGSISNLTNSPWKGREGEGKVRIGHSFPSEPSALSLLVQAELDLERPDVATHIRQIELSHDWTAGERARFASEQTRRAEKALVKDEGFARSWEREAPIARARVVGIVSDATVGVGPSIVLARPILISNLG